MKTKSVAIVAIFWLFFTAPLFATLSMEIESVSYEPRVHYRYKPAAPKAMIVVKGEVKALVAQEFSASSLKVQVLQKQKNGLWTPFPPLVNKDSQSIGLSVVSIPSRPLDANDTVKFMVIVEALADVLKEGEYLIVIRKGEFAMAAIEWKKKEPTTKVESTTSGGF